MKKKVLIGTVVAAVAGVVVGILVCKNKQFYISDFIGNNDYGSFDDGYDS